MGFRPSYATKNSRRRESQHTPARKTDVLSSYVIPSSVKKLHLIRLPGTSIPGRALLSQLLEVLATATSADALECFPPTGSFAFCQKPEVRLFSLKKEGTQSRTERRPDCALLVLLSKEYHLLHMTELAGHDSVEVGSRWNLHT